MEIPIPNKIALPDRKVHRVDIHALPDLLRIVGIVKAAL